MKRALRLSFASIALALVGWLGFVAWSIYSILPDGANDVGSDLPAQPGHNASPKPSSRDPEPELPRADIEPPPQLPVAVEAAAECSSSSDAPFLWYAEERSITPPAEPVPATAAELEERAMAGDVTAQFLIGFVLEQELLGSTPKGERPAFASQRFEYMRNFLILALRNGRRSAANALANAYLVAQRDVVETAAWLRISGDLDGWERQGLIVLSNEQRAESMRFAMELAKQYNLPVSRDRTRGVSGGSASSPAAQDCISDGADPYSHAAAELGAYRADLERNAQSPGLVAEAELRRRFREIRTRFVASLQLGNRGALPMLVALHRTSSTDEDAVAAAAWERVGRELYGSSLTPESPDESATDTLAGLSPSAELPRSGLKFSDPKQQELADNVRRRGVRAGILAEQYILMLDLD